MYSEPLYIESYVSRHLLLRGIVVAALFGLSFSALWTMDRGSYQDSLFFFLFFFGIALVGYVSLFRSFDSTCVMYYADHLDISTKRKTLTVTYKELKRVWIGEYYPRRLNLRPAGLMAQKHPSERSELDGYAHAEPLIWGPGKDYNQGNALILERHNLKQLFVLRCQDFDRVRTIFIIQAPQIDISGMNEPYETSA